jgi:three-Cys-motif partner protein
MSKKQRSKIRMLDHSKAKVELLQKYLERYLNIICNDGFTKRIDIFDLFCGEGIYENGGEGSPIVILKIIKDIHTLNEVKGKTISKIDVIFNDNDKFKIDKLKAAILSHQLHDSKFGKIVFRNKDYKQIIEPLAKHIQSFKNEKAFVFIDPYGYKEIRASEIKNLLISKKSEVLLFLPTQFMYRFDEKGTPQALIEILEELVNLDGWKPNGSVYEFISQFKEGLKNYLGADYFVDTFTIQKDETTVFCLFFFSSHIRGFEKMLETKWQIDEDEGKGWSYEKTGNLFLAFKTNFLEQKLVNFINDKNKCFNGNIYEYTLRLGFLPTHATEIFTSLQSVGRLEVLSQTPGDVRKGAFYINYENYRENPERVYFKIK